MISYSNCIFLIISLLSSAYGDQCLAGTGSTTPCNDVIIVQDFSYYMSNQSFVLKSYDFVRDILLPAYDLSDHRYGVALAAFGFTDHMGLEIESPLLVFFTRRDPQAICADVEHLKNFTNPADNILGAEYLARVFYEIDYYATRDGNSYSTIILFTACRNQEEIDVAGEYYQKVLGRVGQSYHLIIISINNPDINYGAFRSVARIYRTRDFSDFTSADATCIAKAGCGDYAGCDATTPSAGYTGAHFTAGSTAAPLPTKPLPTGLTMQQVTSTPITTIRTTAKSTTTTTTTMATTTHGGGGFPVLNASAYGCDCDLNKIWLDVMVVMDSSSAMTSRGQAELSNFLLTAFLQMRIGQAFAQVSRIGLITYAKDAVLVYPLTFFTTSFDIAVKWDPAFLNQNATNLSGALRVAQDEFTRINEHRNNTKRVIVIAASIYYPDQYADPRLIANQLKQNGIKIITLEYVQNHGAPVPLLAELASPNYNLTNRGEELRVSNFTFLLCQANCFCPTQWNGYKLNKWQAPEGGCYYPYLIPAANILGTRVCHNNGAILAEIEDQQKALFIVSAYTTKQTWIGLQYTNNTWLWNDNTALGTYAPWAENNPNLSKGNCVWQNSPSGFKIEWTSVNCFSDYMYTCQKKPCTSVNFCAEAI